MRARLRRWAQRLRRDTYALYLAGRDPRTPWYAKVLALAVVAYALSPIDLIPDFIPVLGYLDDLILVPLGIALVLRLVPPEVLAQARKRSQQVLGKGWRGARVAGTVVVALWLGLLALLAVWLYRLVS